MRRSNLVGVIAVCMTFLASSAAWARTEVLRWQHQDPSSVASFTVYVVGESNGQQINKINVGKPTQVNGVYRYDLSVSDGFNVRVSVSARGTNGLESSRSNEQLRSASSQPPPPSGGGQLGTPGRPRVVSP